jgi:hypothetical protein
MRFIMATFCFLPFTVKSPGSAGGYATSSFIGE